MDIEQGIFNRTERLVGEDILQSLQSKRVIVFGVGGVGSWCVEALVRSGVRHITIVDSDKVAISNVNRQLMATTKPWGVSRWMHSKNIFSTSTRMQISLPCR